MTGITEDLRRPVGMQVDWWVFDPVSTTVDPIYDVGSSDIGRRWLNPIKVPVIVAQVFQGQTIQDERGLYNADVLRFTMNMGETVSFLPDLITNTDLHNKDRVVYRDGVFRPSRIYLRGQVVTTYTILTVDLVQVKSEELVNDMQFQGYVSSEL